MKLWRNKSSAICYYYLPSDAQLEGHFISNIHTPLSYLLTLSVSRRSFEGSFYIKYSYSSQLFVNSFCQWVLI